MRSFVLRHGVLVGIAFLAIGTALFFIVSLLTRDPLEGITVATADTGVVESIVSVSGVTKSRNTAELAFPTSGIVALIPVAEGDVVTAGTILATLGTTRELASLEKAKADLAIAEANLENLLSGTRSEARAVTSANVEAARQEVARVTIESDQAIENATRALYSTDLEAKSTDPFEPAPAPLISGTYRCETPGSYTLTIYNSSAASGYSMRISGLETGISSASADQASPFGACGLYAKLSETHTYHNTVWTVTIPNTASSNYVSLKNALDLAKTNRNHAIADAKEALLLAERKQTLENATPLPTDVRTAEAKVTQAKAAVAEISSTLADRSIVAPFAGTITNIDILPGESAPTTPVITLLATDAFEVVARVPEIDITEIAEGQSVRVRFDAKQDELRTGTIDFIAPLPSTIDGVAYFEVDIKLNDIPAWLRGGLNADIDIVTGQSENATRIPTRYLGADGTSVRILSGQKLSTTSVDVLFRGNDGFIAIRGIAPGTTIVAP